jgi:multimeric flavodoxin WrbA
MHAPPHVFLALKILERQAGRSGQGRATDDLPSRGSPWPSHHLGISRGPCRLLHACERQGYSLDMSNGVTALVLVCTLKSSPATSSSELLATQVLAALRQQGVEGHLVRVVDHGVRFGVSTDEGEDDGWPRIRDQMLAADILVIATPIWMGQPSSVCKMVLERLDAELRETDDEGRLLTYGKAAMVAAVGNEDGAHHVIAECLQALNDTGFSIAPNAGTYWVGQAMQTTDYQELDPSPEETTSATRSAVANTVHLARLLQGSDYPPP